MFDLWKNKDKFGDPILQEYFNNTLPASFKHMNNSANILISLRNGAFIFLLCSLIAWCAGYIKLKRIKTQLNL